MANPKDTLNEVLAWIGLEPFADTPKPSFNRKPLAQIYPWGTIREATPEANWATAKELTVDDHDDITRECQVALEMIYD